MGMLENMEEKLDLIIEKLDKVLKQETKVCETPPEKEKSKKKKKEPTVDQIRTALKDFVAKKGTDEATTLMKEFSATKVGEIKVEDRERFLEKCQKK